MKQTAIESNAIRDAHTFATDAHAGQTRGNGEPYITHPVAVAGLLSQLGMPEPVVIAGLLHDTVEDCEVTLTDVHDRFGPEVTVLVDGMTKVIRADGSADKDATFRKLLAYAHRDPRVLLVKLCDVRHNSSDLHGLALPKREAFARIALGFYAPLARALGFAEIAARIERDAGRWIEGPAEEFLRQYATPGMLALLKGKLNEVD